MTDKSDKKIPSFLKTVYLSNREIRLILAGLYALDMPKEEIEGALWKKLLFEKLHKKTRRKKNQVKSALERDNIILEAALEWGADCMYDIQNGTLGPTLYIDAPNKLEASYIRKEVPIFFQGLYTVVRYPTHILTPADEDDHKDPYDLQDYK